MVTMAMGAKECGRIAAGWVQSMGNSHDEQCAWKNKTRMNLQHDPNCHIPLPFTCESQVVIKLLSYSSPHSSLADCSVSNAHHLNSSVRRWSRAGNPRSHCTAAHRLCIAWWSHIRTRSACNCSELGGRDELGMNAEWNELRRRPEFGQMNDAAHYAVIDTRYQQVALDLANWISVNRW